MKITITIILILVGFKSISQSKDVEIIPWSSDYKLKWEDFKGPVIDSINGLAATCAQVDVEISYSNDSLRYSVTNYFISNLSFVDSKILEVVNDGLDGLLQHEQLHFDISEIHARLMRKSLIRFSNSNSIDQVELENEIDKIYQAKYDMDSLYDLQTNHGGLILKQLDWQIKVKKHLDELEPYYKPYIK